jgi:NADPH:quinone reductase-like Zn-dependent oxidoreductase
MRAVVYRAYGPPDVLTIEEVARPTPGDGELLIAVHAASVSASDVTFRRGVPFVARSATGLTRPRKPILGSELAGVVEGVGPRVGAFREGDRVAAASAADFGAYAEYICLPESGAVVALPDDLEYADAVGIFEGALTALPFLRDKGNVRSGQRVLINGASGSVGTAAVQLAKHFGAEVTAVTSGANAELVRSIGADHVIDYTREDFARKGSAYDLIFDTVRKSTYGHARASLAPRGVYLSTVLTMGIVMWSLVSRFGSRRAGFMATGLRPPQQKAKDMHFIRDLVEAGALRPVIDRTYPLEQAREAHGYVEGGHKKGNVVLQVRASA